jgi:hypothetical protein
MSYRDIDALTNDVLFAGRVRACAMQEAEKFKDDARPRFVALAADVARGGGPTTLAFVRIVAAAPGIADKAATGDGIDQTRVTDADLLSLVQAQWEVVAGLYFDEDGKPKEV